ncbi:hypothetical protein [Actinospica sp.]|jgi:hypothetical protein|uniref:hypothetical protein n=1 Tax=Actinospica sp. TaxID=1872142 RepID=UPI002BDD3689|nr:hypothetical protein [Actinospica sp.]HWG25228.1 hypothetical protein [Actinospica sp.]
MGGRVRVRREVLVERDVTLRLADQPTGESADQGASSRDGFSVLPGVDNERRPPPPDIVVYVGPATQAS